MHNECVEYTMDDFEFFQWYHVCLVYQDIYDNIVGSHDSQMQLFVNGKLLKEGTIKRTRNNFSLFDICIINCSNDSH